MRLRHKDEGENNCASTLWCRNISIATVNPSDYNE